ncbi:MAG: hypothetical protein WCC59_03780, partial [Terriglobales bacterium]
AMSEVFARTGILILTTRPPLVDFTFFFLRLAEERLTLAAGFFFIELHLRNCRRGPLWDSLWKRLRHESTFIYEKRQCASTRPFPRLLARVRHGAKMKNVESVVPLLINGH